MGRQWMKKENPAAMAFAVTARGAQAGGPAASAAGLVAPVPSSAGAMIPGAHGVRKP